MNKLLSIVLSISILFSSVAPSFSGVRIRRTKMESQVTRKVFRETSRPRSIIRQRILTRQTEGLANHILTRPSTERAPLMRDEFVALSFIPDAINPAQRFQAVSVYAEQLKKSRSAFKIPQIQLERPLSAPVQAIQQARYMLSDASALGLVGVHEQAPTLLDFYKQSQGTVFADTATLITARGLLRMQAYEELGALLAENAENPVLSGMAEYIKVHELPVEVPTTLQGLTARPVDPAWVSFLEIDSPINRLHADASLQATERWMALSSEEVAASWAERIAQVLEEETFPASAQTAAGTSLAEEVVAQAEHTISATEKTRTEAASGSEENATLPLSQYAPKEKQDLPSSAQTNIPQRTSSSSSGIVYGGIPFFAITDGLSNLAKRIRGRFGKKTRQEAPYEEPGLHDNTSRPVYEEGDVPEIIRDGEEVSVIDNQIEVMVGVEGFKLSITKEDGAEHVLKNVDLTVDGALKNFDPAYNRLVLDSKNIFELRNTTLGAKRPDHFYFVLQLRNGELSLLLDGADKLGLSRPLTIKIQRTTSPMRTVTLPIYKWVENEGKAVKTQVVAQVDAKLLPVKKAEAEKGALVVDGDVICFRSQEGEMTPLEDAFIRLPKNESEHWTKILAMYDQAKFSIGVFSTKDKMPPLTYLVPALQIGLGKTLSPILEGYTDLSETAASYTMMGINNGLPALMAFVNPFLDRFGETPVYRLGVASLFVAGLGALASGLYGHLGAFMTPLQLGAFLTSSTFMAFGVSVTRYLQGLLILANRGIVREGNAFKNVKTGETVHVTYNAKHLVTRAKEVITKKGAGKLLRDLMNLQWASIFKNVGTAGFLVYPALANWIGKAFFGVELGLDFSASYVPYTLFSLYTLRKVYKTRFKDSFPLDITSLRNNLKDIQSKVVSQVSHIDLKDPAKMQEEKVLQIPWPSFHFPMPGGFTQDPFVKSSGLKKAVTFRHSDVLVGAKEINEAIERLVPVEARKTKEAPKGLTRKYETEFGDALEERLIAEGRTPEEAKEIRQAFRGAFDALNQRDVSLMSVMFLPGLFFSLSGMTLATMGELAFSNNFAFIIRALVGDATAATAIVGGLLYGSMIVWRVLGNFLLKRGLSGGSMYALSSTAAVLGPAMMAMFPDSLALLMTGASISCFGISNFFGQMYNYIIKLHPEYKRKVALLINLTMPLAALGAPLFRLAGHIPGLDMALVSAVMAGSVILTPKMLADSSFLKVMAHSLMNVIVATDINKNLFLSSGTRTSRIANSIIQWRKKAKDSPRYSEQQNNGGNEPPLIENPAQ